VIDVEHESQLVRERSAELAGQLDAAAAVVTVDHAPIEEALAQSRRLAGAASAARAEVSRRLAAGNPAGVPLGPYRPIRRVRTLPDGRDPDPHLQGRLAVTEELVAYHRHRYEVAAAQRNAYAAAAAQFDGRPALVAAARQQISVLRQRQSFAAEGGDQLDAALRRFLDIAGHLRQAMLEADEISGAASAALDQMRAAPLQAAMEEAGGPMADLGLAQYAMARASAAMGSAPLDATTGRPVEAKPARRR
jgi:hypothetical protein